MMPQTGISQQQRACLELVAKGMTSKEIAIELGVSPLTVDDYIKRAVARLGATSRREAARMIVADQMGPPQSLGHHPPPVASTHPSQQEGPAQKELGLAPGAFRLPPVGGRVNDHTFGQRLIGISRIGFIAALLLITAVVIIQGVIALLIR